MLRTHVKQLSSVFTCSWHKQETDELCLAIRVHHFWGAVWCDLMEDTSASLRIFQQCHWCNLYFRRIRWFSNSQLAKINFNSISVISIALLFLFTFLRQGLIYLRLDSKIYVVEGDLEPIILLPLASKRRAYRWISPYLAYYQVFENNANASQ